jgi:hypothetical protein
MHLTPQAQCTQCITNALCNALCIASPGKDRIMQSALPGAALAVPQAGLLGLRRSAPRGQLEQLQVQVELNEKQLFGAPPTGLGRVG